MSGRSGFDRSKLSELFLGVMMEYCSDNESCSDEVDLELLRDDIESEGQLSRGLLDVSAFCETGVILRRGIVCCFKVVN